MNEYLFKSRKGNGSIGEQTLWDIMNKASIDAGITKNIGSHSLRKTWGYTIWHRAEDKSKALVMLQQCLNHSDSLQLLQFLTF